MWTYDKQPFEEVGEYIGFVYLITNLLNDKKYIGKKNFYFSKTKQVKGKKKRFKVESDWRTYYGSNKELLKDVETHGEKAFRREILVLCKSKGEFAYHEARLQFENKVLETEDWYNSWIMVRVHKRHLNVKNKSNPR